MSDCVVIGGLGGVLFVYFIWVTHMTHRFIAQTEALHRELIQKYEQEGEQP